MTTKTDLLRLEKRIEKLNKPIDLRLLETILFHILLENGETDIDRLALMEFLKESDEIKKYRDEEGVK